MSLDLPSEFDFIVIGTGITESILAAACARIGYSVLHLDRNEYYSGEWASFNLQGIDKWVACSKGEIGDELKRPTIDLSTILEPEEQAVELPLNPSNINFAEVKFHVEDDAEEDTSQVIANDVERRDDSDGNNSSCGLQEGVGDKENLASQADMPAQDDNSQHTTSSVLQSSPKEELAVQEEDISSTKITSGEQNISGGDKDFCVSDIKETDAPSQDLEVHVKSSDDNCEAIAAERPSDSGADIAAQIESLDIKPCQKWTKSRIQKEWRKFNLDLAPRVLYCGGQMVELLIKSDIAKYCEFKTVSRVLTNLNGVLENVPCSRADVFSSKKVSMLEKRMLMKFLTFCADYEKHPEDFEEFSDKPFKEYLHHKKLTENIKHFVQHSIAMVTDTESTIQGLQRSKKYLMSLGRYGNTAFLWPLYGSGELPQAFCRMCAVFGGVYCLRMTASSLILDKNNKCSGVVTSEGQRINCKWLIMDSLYMPESFMLENKSQFISRGMFLTDKSIKQVDTEELSLLRLPDPKDPDKPVTILELPPSAQVCPSDMYVVHMTKAGNGDVEQDLNFAVETLFRRSNEASDTDESAEKPKVLWSLYFSQGDLSSIGRSTSIPENIILISGPGSELDIDRPVIEAEQIFEKIFPGEDFLPKAPNPEDIIYVDDAEASVKEGQTDLISESKEEIDDEPGPPSKESGQISQCTDENSSHYTSADPDVIHGVDDKQCSEKGKKEDESCQSDLVR